MIKKRTFCVGLILLLSTVSCSSLSKKAKQQAEAGNFDEAIELYQQALKKDSLDMDATQGLRLAQDGWIDRKLILVRMARLGGSSQYAMDLLLDVVTKEKEWRYAPKGKVAFTQSEETDYAFPRFEKVVHEAASEKSQPLLAQRLERRYGDLFGEKEFLARRKALDSEISTSGKKTCKEFQETVSRKLPYYSEWVGRYCAHFSMSCPSCVSNAQAIAIGLFHDLSWQGEVSKLTPEQEGALKQTLKVAFRESPWYHGSAHEKAKLKLEGSYKASHAKNLVSLVKEYSAQEPYQTVEYVSKRRPVTKYNSQGSPYQDFENYSEPQNVVRYRTVTKTFPYSAIKHEQNLEFDVHGNISIGNNEMLFKQNEASKSEGYEHDLTVSQVDLYPSKPDLVDPNQWLNQQMNALSARFRESLNSEWISHFCKDFSPDSLATKGNQVLKCLRARPKEVPTEIDEWFLECTGLNWGNVEAVLAGQ